jgi:hypothetical protein
MPSRTPRLTGKSRTTLPQFEPVRSATGLSTPHPCGNPVFRNAFLTRLRRGDCARHLSSTDSELCVPMRSLCAAPLSATGLRPHLTPAPTASRSATGRRRGIAVEAPHRVLPSTRRANNSCHASCCRPHPKNGSRRSASGNNWGGFAPAALLKTCSLPLASAQMFSGFQILFLRSYSHDF